MFRFDFTKEEVKILILLVFGHLEANLTDDKAYKDLQMSRLAELLRLLIREYTKKSL